LQECEHNPKRAVLCTEGCGLAVPRDELGKHNCVLELRRAFQAQEAKVGELQSEVSSCKYQLAEQRRDINILKDQLRTLRGVSSVANVSAMVGRREGGARTVTNQIQENEMDTWASRLAVARVSRWGGMISTPDAGLQSSIKRALLDTGCPADVCDELMANAHERRWPAGLLTLETRQANRRQYEQYVCRRVPGKQAVAVLACDNLHMSDDMILSPGLVMIFAHGIE